MVYSLEAAQSLGWVSIQLYLLKKKDDYKIYP